VRTQQCVDAFSCEWSAGVCNVENVVDYAQRNLRPVTFGSVDTVLEELKQLTLSIAALSDATLCTDVRAPINHVHGDLWIKTA
jgi:hypothetical protein